MKKLMIKKYGLTLVGVAVGLIGGYFYWKQVGCATGTCPITSSPLMSTLWGGMMGGLLFDMFRPREKKED